MYSYVFSPVIARVVPLEEMQKRYGLEKAWEGYAQMERDFVEDNRRYDKNRLFWDNTYLDPKKIIANRNRFPAILVECGFLSNYQEEAKLRDDQYQKQVTAVIAATCSTFLHGN